MHGDVFYDVFDNFTDDSAADDERELQAIEPELGHDVLINEESDEVLDELIDEAIARTVRRGHGKAKLRHPALGGRSNVRLVFERSASRRDWRNAYLNLNALNMYEMLRALANLTAGQLNQFWDRRALYENVVNIPRISYARSVVVNKILPSVTSGDLKSTGQVAHAADCLAERLAPIARRVNRNPVNSISLILRECNFYDISDKSHIAYLLASAHHESHMGGMMTERWGPTDEQRRYEGRGDLGNVLRGDGFRYRGRGFVQITGRRHYKFYSRVLRTRALRDDLETDPDRAAHAHIAAIIIAHGMRYGTFRGRGLSLSRFGTDCGYNFTRARAIINADVARNGPTIAAIATRYRAALN